MCILKEVDKFREQDDNHSFFSWLGGLSITEETVHEPVLDMNSSVEDCGIAFFNTKRQEQREILFVSNSAEQTRILKRT